MVNFTPQKREYAKIDFRVSKSHRELSHREFERKKYEKHERKIQRIFYSGAQKVLIINTFKLKSKLNV
jgi:hypothetical protein